jgi:hypothetical protein
LQERHLVPIRRRDFCWIRRSRPLLAFAACLVLSASSGAQTSNDVEFGRGLIFERLEDLQGVPRARGFRAYIPVEKDLSELMPPPGQQRGQGSCVGWAVAYAARTYHYASDNGVSPSASENIASPAALYNAIRDPKKDCGVGSRIVDALRHLQNVGVPSLAEFPYDPKQCSRLPQATQSTGRFRIREWQRVDVAVLDDVKGQIARGRPVVIGVAPHDSFKDYRGGVYADKRTDDSRGHALSVVGYSDQRQAFKVINSWGLGWGIRGYGWVSYDAFAAMTKYGFVMTTRAATPLPVPPAPVAVVTPKPTPPVEPKPQPQPVVQPPPPMPAPDAPSLPPHLAELPAQVRDIVSSVECSGISHFDRGRRALKAYIGNAEARDDFQTKLSAALAGYRIDVEHRPLAPM